MIIIASKNTKRIEGELGEHAAMIEEKGQMGRMNLTLVNELKMNVTTTQNRTA